MTREERDKALELGIRELMLLEQKFATGEYGTWYNSPAEGTAIVREECAEVMSGAGWADCYVQKLDYHTRNHQIRLGFENAVKVRDTAIETAIEAIHLAAAADKWLSSAAISANRSWRDRTDQHKESAAETKNHSADSATPMTDTDSVPH